MVCEGLSQKHIFINTSSQAAGTSGCWTLTTAVQVAELCPRHLLLWGHWQVALLAE